MLGLLLLLLAAAAVFGRLGAWQLDRADLRGAAEARERAAAVEAADPVPLAEALAPQAAFSGNAVGRKVEVRGTYEADQLLVPGRALDDRTGFAVLTPLRVSDGEGSGAVLAVVRGWVAEAADAPAAPSGPVRLVGYLQAGEAASEAELPDGQVEAISPAELVNRWGGPTWSGYLVVAESEPPQDGVELLPPPTAGARGLALQNLAYALQWWLFGGFAVLLWIRMVRDQAADDTADADDPRHATQAEPEPVEP